MNSLVVGDDRQRLELRGRELGRLAGLKRFCHIFRHLGRRAHLIGVFQPHDADAAAGIAQLVHQGLAGRVDLIFVVLERLAQAFGVDRLARGEQDGHQGPL